jgi:hypothetical protein
MAAERDEWEKRRMEASLARTRISWYQERVAETIGSKWEATWGILGGIDLGDGVGKRLVVRAVGRDPNRPNDCKFFLVYVDNGVLLTDECEFEPVGCHVRWMDFYNSTGRVILGDEVKIPVRMGNLDVEGWNGGMPLSFEVFPSRDSVGQALWLDDFFIFLAR